MKIVLIGKGAILFNIAKLLANNNSIEILSVIWDTNKNDKSEKYYLKNIKKLFKVLSLRNINSNSNFNYLKRIKFDYLLSINNTQIFGEKILNKFKEKIVNYHYSLIPSYKGLYSCTKVLLKQEKFTGISWHHVTKKIDNGKIIFQKKLKIKSNDNAAILISRLNLLCLRYLNSFLFNLKKKIIIKNSNKTKDFKLYLKEHKYSKINSGMNYKKMKSIFNAFNYHPFDSPLPKVQIKLDKIRSIKNMKIINKKKFVFKNYLMLKKNFFIIKSSDKKHILIEIY